MAGWVRDSRKRLVYAGRITRIPFVAWTKSPQGRKVVDKVASTIRFALFGRTRAARRRLWRELAAASRDEDVVATLQTELNVYLTRLGGLAFSPGLPGERVQLRRLVVVPNVLVNGDAYGALDTRLSAQPAFALLEGGEALRQFFILKVIEDIDAAIRRARPSPRNPREGGSGWISVGLNSTFEWLLPVNNEPGWPGHHYVLELTREPITRALRKAVAASVTRLEALLPTLSRLERNEILRRARYVA
jgi:hypothetical protein